jgi:nucleoid-associated protein YgaU
MRASIARSVGDIGAVQGLDTLLDAAAHLNIKNFAVQHEHGKTVISGMAKYQLDREMFFDAIKQLDGWESDVVLAISVERHDVRGYHTVRDGETLAEIAEQHMGSAAREMDIFQANRDRMNDPDQIFPGQQLLIPRR